MKSLLKGGTTATLGLVLCTTFAAKANVVPNPHVTDNSILTNQSNKVLNNTIKISSSEGATSRYKGKASWVSGISVEKIPTAPSTALDIAKFLPDDTPIVATLNTRGETWNSLRRFHLFQMASDFIAGFIPANVSFDYGKYVESWLGEQVAFAFLPKTGSATASIDSNFAIIAPIKNKTLVQPFVDSLKGDRQKVTERQYKGITIIEIKVPESSLPTTNPLPPILTPAPKAGKSPALKKERTLAIALTPDYLLGGYNGKTIERLIDSAEGNTSTVAENSEYQKTMQQSQERNVLFAMYQNPVTWLPLLKDIAKDPSFPLSNFGFDQFDAKDFNRYRSINAFVTIQSEGLTLQTNAYRQSPQENPETVSNSQPSAILSRMPAATYSAFTSRNLNKQWQSIVQIFNTTPELKDGLKSFRDFFRNSIGLDFDRDVIGWMDNDYAFFLYPTKGGFFNTFMPNFNLGIGMVVQTNNRGTADATLKKLEDVAKTSWGAGIKNRDIKGHPITSWEYGNSSAQSLLAYSWVNDDTFVLTTGSSAIADLVPQPKVLLPATYNFNTAINPLPRPNNGYLYMNMGSFLSWAYGFVPREFNDPNFKLFKQTMGSVYSISATTSEASDREQLDVLFVLAPNRKYNK